MPLLEEKNNSRKGKKELAMPPQSEYWEVAHSLNHWIFGCGSTHDEES